MLFIKPSKNMKKLIYLLVLPLIVISSLVFANKELKDISDSKRLNDGKPVASTKRTVIGNDQKISRKSNNSIQQPVIDIPNDQKIVRKSNNSIQQPVINIPVEPNSHVPTVEIKLDPAYYEEVLSMMSSIYSNKPVENRAPADTTIQGIRRAAHHQADLMKLLMDIKKYRYKVKLNDIVEFHTANFKSAPNSTVAKGLKSIPGIEVNTEGEIKFRGEDIKKVFINGRNLFGRNIKVSTGSLPYNIISDIQLYKYEGEELLNLELNP